MRAIPRVAVVGDNTIDRFVDAAGIELVGGNALNVAVQLSMLGLSVSYYGAVADDDDGRLVRDAAHLRGVNLDGLEILPGSTALTQIRRNAGGERFFVHEDFGVTAEYAPAESARAKIVSSDWVHIGMLPNAGLLRAQIKEAKPGLPVSQDCSVSAGWNDLAVAFVSAGESEEVAESLVGTALAGGSELAVATMGALGVRAGNARGQRWRFPSQPTDVVDSTGAGDSFIAGFIGDYLRHLDVSSALTTGIRSGAQACRYYGGWPQLAADIDVFG